MNVELLMKVRDKILAEPSCLDMADWVCGTTACVAGWAVKLAGHEVGENPLTIDARIVKYHEFGDVASGLLGLTPREADALFFFSPPTDFCDSDGRYATVVAERIEDVIAGRHS